MNTATSDITDLIHQARGGDTAAFGQIVRRYQGLVSGVLFSATGDFHKSEDLAQETFLIAWNKLGELENTGNPAPWLCTIARNLVNRSFRGKTVDTVHGSLRGGSLGSEQISTEPEPSAELQRREQSELVWSAIGEIDEKYRETLVLYYRSGQSVREIADATALTEEAVRQRLVRARKSLKVKLEEMIGDILTDTAPGDVFTYGVMAAVTTVVVSTSAQAAAAGTTGTIATGTTGKAIGLGSLWVMLGPLFYFVWMFAIVFISQWTLAQNTPTLRARRYRIHSFFLVCQYFVPFIAVLGTVTAGLLSWVTKPGIPSSSSIVFLTGFAPSISIGLMLVYFYNRRIKAIIKDDLGLSEKHVDSFGFEQTQRRLHLSVITNILLLETAMLAALVLPLSRGAGTWWSAAITLAVGGLFGLVLYAYYLFGRHFLLLCRSQASMTDYPPLLDNPFEVALGLIIKAPAAIEHKKKAGHLYWFGYLLWIGLGGTVLWLLSLLPWKRQPLLIALCVAGLFVSIGVRAFLRRRAKEKMTFYLIDAVMGLCDSALAYALLGIVCGTYSFLGIWRSGGTAGPANAIGMSLFLYMTISFVASVACIVAWLRLKFGKVEEHPSIDEPRFASAIAQYPPDDTESEECVSPSGIPQKWIRIFIVYGIVVLLFFASVLIFRDRLFGQTVRRMHYVHSGNYTAMIELEPDNPIFYFQRGCRESNPSKAIEDFDTAIRLNPGYVEAYIKRADAYNGGQMIQELTPKRASLFHKAVADCDEAIRLDPNNDEAWRVRGQSNLCLGNYVEALADATKAIELKNASTNYFHRAVLYDSIGNVVNALADCTEAIRLQEENNRHYGSDHRDVSRMLNEYVKPFYHYRASLYQKLGEHDKAKADLEKAK